MANIEKQLNNISLQCNILGKNLVELTKEVRYLKKENKDYIQKILDDKETQLSKLRDDCIKMLKLLTSKSIITAEELNKAIQ